jgi:hypothetical protein
MDRLVSSAEKYDPQVFKDLIIKFDFGQFDSEKILAIEQKLWKKLDKEKDKDSSLYKNLLELDSKLFNSLQPKDVLF